MARYRRQCRKDREHDEGAERHIVTEASSALAEQPATGHHEAEHDHPLPEEVDEHPSGKLNGVRNGRHQAPPFRSRASSRSISAFSSVSSSEVARLAPSACMASAAAEPSKLRSMSWRSTPWSVSSSATAAS